jgi:uncharacterized protein (TIGR03435 family)
MSTMRILAGFLVAFLTVAGGQTPLAPPQFEVAAIKPSPPDSMSFEMSGGPGTKDPGLFRCENVDLTSLVTMAFDVPRYRFSGPDWMRSTRFNISAKIPDGTTKEQFALMQQNLLTERFKMTFHREKKEMQGYDLVVAKNGPKIKESAQTPPPAELDSPKSPPAGPYKIGTDGFPILPPGREWRTGIAGRRLVQRFTDATMERVAALLASSLARPINDATDLKGKYDFTVKWIMDWGPPSPDDSGPDIFQALQEQLGLKLEPKKVMVDLLVVDHIEKTPTEN